jgi:hypothetical protein
MAGVGSSAVADDDAHLENRMAVLIAAPNGSLGCSRR